jgi:2-hydroxy-6-oxonona-2,4-dienedioate hydrolase
MLKLLKYLLYSVILFTLLIVAIAYILPVNSSELKSEFKPFVNSRYYSSSDVKLHYREWPPAKPIGNVLLIHGFSGSTYSWRFTADFLFQKGYRVICVDVPPFGFSERKAELDYNTDQQAKRLWNLCRNIDSINNWSIAGHSMGAQLAGMMAAQKPDRCNNLILVDGIFSESENTFKKPFFSGALTLAPFKRVAEAVGKNYLFNPQKFSELLESAYGQKPDSADVAAYLQPFTIKNTASCIIESANAKQHSHNSFNDIKAPILMIWGEKDKWIPLETGLEFSEKYPVIKLYRIKEAGHCPMETHAQEFNSIFLNFLQ